MMRLSLVCLFVCMWRVVWWCWLLMYVRGAVCVRVLLWLCAGVKILCAGWRITIWAPGEGNERPWMCPFAWLSLYQISRAALIVLIALAKSGVSQTKKKGVLRKMQQKKRKSQTNKAKRESEKKIIVSTRDVISLCLLWEIHIVRFRHFVVPFCLPFKKATKPCEGTPNTQKNIFTLHNPHFFFPFHLKFLSRRFKTTSTVPKAYFGAAQFSEGSSGLGQGCGYCAVITMCAPPQRCFEKNCRRWCWLQKSRGQSGTIWIWNSKRGWSDLYEVFVDLIRVNADAMAGVTEKKKQSKLAGNLPWCSKKPDGAIEKHQATKAEKPPPQLKEEEEEVEREINNSL